MICIVVAVKLWGWPPSLWNIHSKIPELLSEVTASNSCAASDFVTSPFNSSLNYVTFSLLARYLVYLQVCIMETALENHHLPACRWELDQEGSLEPITKPRGNPNCVIFPLPQHRALTPLTQAIVCPGETRGTSLGQEPHRKQRNSTRTETRESGVVRTNRRKVNFSTNATSQQRRGKRGGGTGAFLIWGSS